MTTARITLALVVGLYAAGGCKKHEQQLENRVDKPLRGPAIVTRDSPDAIAAAGATSQLIVAGFRGVTVEAEGGAVRVVGIVPRDRHDEVMRIVMASVPRGMPVHDQLKVE